MKDILETVSVEYGDIIITHLAETWNWDTETFGQLLIYLN